MLVAFILPMVGQASPNNFNFQANIRKPDGTRLEENNVSYRFSYLNTLGTCTLYIEEFNNVSMVGTSGNISFSMGTGTKVFPPASVSLSETFSNSTSNSMSCSEGGSYTPLATTEIRKLKVEFVYTGSGGVQSLNGIEISSVPYSMYSSDSDRLGGVMANLFSKISDFQTCSPGEFLYKDGAGHFYCDTPSSFSGNLSGDVTGAQATTTVARLRGIPLAVTAPTLNQVLQFDGTNWVPQTIAAYGGTVTSLSSANAYMTVTSPTTTPVLTINVGTSANTVAAGDDSRIVGAFQTATALGGDLSGNLPNPTVATVGGKTAAQISTSVDDTLNATNTATASRIVKRDSSGNAAFVTVQATNFSGRSLVLYEPTDTNHVTVQAPTTFTGGNYVLTLPQSKGLAGQVLSTDGNGVTSWVPASTGSVTSVGATLPLTSTGGATPTIAMPAAATAQDGYLTAADWNTFNSKQPAGSYVTTTLTTGNVFVGNGSNVATNTTLSGDIASISGTGVVALKNTGTAGTYGSSSLIPSITTDAQGRVTGVTTSAYQDGSATVKGVLEVGTNLQVAGGVISLQNASTTLTGALTSADWNTFNNKQNALGYTPVNRAGDTMTGALNMGAFDITNSGNIIMAANKSFGLSQLTAAQQTTLAGTLTAADKGRTWFNTTTDKMMYWDGSAAQVLSSASGSVSTVTASLPLSSSGGVTPNITMPAAATAQDGYLTAADWNTFNSKQPAGSYITALTGDVVAAGPGSSAATIQANAITTSKINNLAVTDAKINDVAWGKITSKPTTLGGYGITDAISAALNSAQILVGNGSNIATPVSLSGDATLSNTGSVTLASTVTAGTVGSASAVPTITYDAKGRITGTSSNAYQDATGVSKGIVQAGANISVTGGVISVPTANGVVAGVLSAADYNTFNNKVSSQWVTSGANIYNSNVGNVGIGTTSPTSMLQVKGVNGTSMSLTNTSALDLWNPDGGPGTGAQINFRSDGNAGAAGIGAVIGYINRSSTAAIGSQGDLAFGVKSNAGDTSVTQAMTIKGNGNVGIGNTNPSYALDVTGSARVANGWLYMSDNYGPTWGGNYIAGHSTNDTLSLSTGYQNRLHINSSGNIGIGTTTPSSKLHVNGGAITQSPSAAANANNYLNTNGSAAASTSLLNPGVAVYNDSANVYGMDLGHNGRYRTRIFAPTTGDVVLSSSNVGAPTAQSDFTDHLVIRGDTGNVGIGRTTANYKLDVNGDINIPSGSNFKINGVNIGLGTIGGSGTTNTVPKFTAAGTIGDSNITDNGTVVDVSTDATVNGITVGRGGGNVNLNTAIGYSALSSNTTGAVNVANGAYSMTSNTTGNENTAIGYVSLRFNTTGSVNTAIGRESLYANTTGNNNTALGRSSLSANTVGNNNTALGFSSGAAITTGNNNVILGSNNGSSIATSSNNIIISDGSGNIRQQIDSTGKVGIGMAPATYMLNVNGDVNLAAGSNFRINGAIVGTGTIGGSGTTDTIPKFTASGTIGNSNLSDNGMFIVSSIDAFINGLRVGRGNGLISTNSAFGANALATNTTGNQNTANGYFSLYSNTTGSQNTSVGAGSLYNNTTGSENTAIGTSTLNQNTTGNNNTAVGVNVLNVNTTGYYNSAIGAYSMMSNTTGSNNTASGFQTLHNNTTGTSNTASGFQSLMNNTTGDYNTATGSTALTQNTTGTYNVATGSSALSGNTTGNYNTASGALALLSNNTGSDNTASGTYALRTNMSGSGNTANGSNSLFNNTTGGNNIATGYQSLYYNTAGNNNVATGYQSLMNNTTGVNNTAVGTYAGRAITTGSNNVIIGSNDGSSIATSNNNIIISDGSGNTRLLANSSGNVGIGTTNPTDLLTIEKNQSAVTAISVKNSDATSGAYLQLYSDNGLLGEVVAGGSNTGGGPWQNRLSLYSYAPGDGIALITGNNAPIVFATNNTLERMRILESGNIGIGTSTPGQKLSVDGTIESTSGGFKFPDGSVQTTAPQYDVDCSASTCVRINKSDGAATFKFFSTVNNSWNTSVAPFAATTAGSYSISCHIDLTGNSDSFCVRLNEATGQSACVMPSGINTTTGPTGWVACTGGNPF